MKKFAAIISTLFLTLVMGQAFANAQEAVVDTAITLEVKTLLLEKKIVDNQSSFNPLAIHVETTNGVVKLTGNVKNDQEKTHAGDIAKSAKGVKSVDNQLVIQAEGTTQTGGAAQTGSTTQNSGAAK